MKKIITIIALCSLFAAVNAIGMDGMTHEKAKQGGHATMDHAKAEPMDHSKMGHGSSQEGGTFKHTAMVDGIHAEFKVMDLASMNMTDPDGRTHHVMASFMKDNDKFTKAVGKVKLISPSGKEQLADLEEFGSGVYAANFTIDEKGKWGVICLFKDGNGKHTVKFWYQHSMM